MVVALTAGKIADQHDGRFTVARRFVQLKRDLSPREHLPVLILDRNGLFAYHSGFAAAAVTHLAQRRRFQRKRAAMMADREKGSCLLDSPEELPHAKLRSAMTCIPMVIFTLGRMARSCEWASSHNTASVTTPVAYSYTTNDLPGVPRHGCSAAV
jgi:hypothetical protein